MANPLDRLRDAVVRIAQIGKLKLDVNFLRRERDELVQLLGERVLSLIERRQLPEHADLALLVSEIRAIDARRSEGLRAAEVIQSELDAEPTQV